MATPTYITALQQINDYIVANGNNEITGPVLNSVLNVILDFANNNIGDLDTLTTDEKNSIVEAINSLKQNFDDLVNNGVQLYTGINDPNITPPPTYNYADFYMQLDIDDLPVKLWQWNGFEWTDASEEPATETDNIINNSGVPGVTATDAFEYLNDNKENVSNKATDFTVVNNDLYPTVQATKTYADSLLVGVINLRGLWDASSNLFPTTGGSGTSGAVRKGDLWYISVAGVLAGKSVNIGDSFFAVIDAPGQTSANWNVMESNIGYVPANDANVIHTTGNETKTGVLTVNSIELPLQALNSSLYKIKGYMATDDTWSIYGEASALDKGIMVFDIGDNAEPFAGIGQKFEFRYSNATSGTPKTPLTIDYSEITSNADLILANEISSTVVSLDSNKKLKSLPTVTYPSLTEIAYVKGATSSIQTQLNGKQSTLTNPVTGTGTNGNIPILTGTSTIGNSSISESAGYTKTTNRLSVAVTPITNIWSQYTNTLQVGQMIYQDYAILPQGVLQFNKYYNGTTEAYINTGGAASIEWMNNGDLEFKTIVSGTSASTVPAGKTMRLKSSGEVNIQSLSGTTTEIVVTDASGNLSKGGVAPASGNYTPTISSLVNTTSVVVLDASYSRVGSVITVSLHGTLNLTVANTYSSFTITLPVNRATSTSYPMGLSMLRNSNVFCNGWVISSLTSQTTIVFNLTPNTAGSTFTANFTYNINN